MIVRYFIIVMVKKNRIIILKIYSKNLGTKSLSDSLLCSSGLIWSSRKNFYFINIQKFDKKYHF